MKWERFKVIHKEASGETDALNNEIYTYVEFAEVPGRWTPWTADDVNIEGRELTENARKLITPAERLLFRTAEQVKHDGSTYEIQQVKDIGRFRVLYVKEYRSWQSTDISS